MPTTLHEPRNVWNRLSHLQRSAVVPTLGEIYRALRQDLAVALGNELRMEIAEKYDTVFANRHDYALWRREFGRENPTTISSEFLTTEDLVQEGLVSYEPVVVWGMLSMTHRLATGRRGDQLFGGDRERLASEMEKAALRSGLAPLSNAYAGCALHRLLTLGAVDNIRFKTMPKGSIPLNQLTDYLNTIQHLIGEIDPSWQPGRAVSFDALNGERLIGPLRLFDLKLRFDALLFSVRESVKCGLRKHPITNPQVQELLARAAQFAFSSWRCARSSRLFIAKLAREGRNRYQLTLSEEIELTSLIRASQAAKHAGNFSLGAKLAFWALRTMPKSLICKPEFAVLGDQISYDIRQFGYEPDERFSRRKVSRFAVKCNAKTVTPRQSENLLSAENQPMTNCPESECTASEHQNVPTKNPVPQATDTQSGQHTKRKHLIGYNPFKAQVLADQQNSNDWKLVLKEYPRVPANPMELLGQVAYDARRIKDEALLRAAFRLCAFKYRLPASSAALIKHFQPTKEEVVTLAALFANVTRAMPIGMDAEVLRDWQNVLRKAWHGLPVSEKIYEEDILSLHEVLLGRGVTVLRASEHATEYAQQFFGDRDDNEIRQLLDCDLSLLHNVKVGAQGNKLKVQIEEFTKTSMKNVVWVSVVSLTPTEWSLLMVGDDGRWHYDRLAFKSSILVEGGCISAMKGWGESWFRVPWKNAPGLRELARTIGEVVSTTYPSARYLQLAIEPRLARLPWNDLFRPIWKKLAVAPVIAIVPNFTWALVANRMDHQHGVQLLAADEESLTGEVAGSDELTAGFFRTVREQLFTTRTLLKQIYSSAVFVLARGAWNPDTKMTDVSGLEGTIALKRATHTDLLDLGNYRIVVAYACRAGHVAQHFLGDLGGIPGVCLSLKTRLLVGPVAEVSPKTAAVLHKHLADAKGPSEIGLRYMQAFQEDRSVAFFNLFGFANESV